MSSRLLDFSNLLAGPEFTACLVMDREEVCVIPNRLDIHASSESDETPVFRFEAIRGITPFSKPEPYGLFEIQLSPVDISQEVMNTIQDKWQASTVFTPDFSSGYLGLSLIANDGENLSDELESAVQLTHLPLSRLRFVRRVSMDYLKLVKEALHKELILLKAYGLFSVKGFSPTFPVTIAFNPEVLTQTLINEMELDASAIRLSTLREFFEKPLAELPVTVQAQEEPEQNFLTASLIDWYTNRFCTIKPPTVNDDEVVFILNEDAKTSGSFTWDLSEPIVVERFNYFTFDALEAARRLLKERSVDELFTTTVVEPVPTGFLRIEVFHPFFQIPVGIRQVGIKLSAPPNPPLRPQAIHKTVVFDRGQGKKPVTLQFSSSEKPSYQVTPFAIYGDQEGTKEVLGELTETAEQELVVEQESFPFRFITFTCSANIMAQASLTLVLKKESQVEALFKPVVLDSNKSSIMFALPKDDSSEFICDVAARDLLTQEVVTTSIPILSDHKIDLSSFREYGSHEVTIQFDAPEGKTVGIDLLPAHLEPDSASITTIAFNNNRQVANWSWFSPSIFKAGFRYRFHGESNVTWSEIQSPFIKELKLAHQKEPI